MYRSRGRLRGRFRALAVGAVAVVAVLISATDAAAYNGAGAAAYAERYVNAPNPSFMYFGSDCTNFVSQATVPGWGTPLRRVAVRGRVQQPCPVVGMGRRLRPNDFMVSCRRPALFPTSE